VRRGQELIGRTAIQNSQSSNPLLREHGRQSISRAGRRGILGTLTAADVPFKVGHLHLLAGLLTWLDRAGAASQWLIAAKAGIREAVCLVFEIAVAASECMGQPSGACRGLVPLPHTGGRKGKRTSARPSCGDCALMQSAVIPVKVCLDKETRRPAPLSRWCA